MSLQLINSYKEQFKEYIMNALVDEEAIPLKQVLQEFIRQKPADYKAINYAYLNVKNELTGDSNTNIRSDEEICERYKHI